MPGSGIKCKRLIDRQLSKKYIGNKEDCLLIINPFFAQSVESFYTLRLIVRLPGAK